MKDLQQIYTKCFNFGENGENGENGEIGEIGEIGGIGGRCIVYRVSCIVYCWFVV